MSGALEERHSTNAFLRRLATGPAASLGKLLGVDLAGRPSAAAKAVDAALALTPTVERVFASVPVPSAHLLLRWILRGDNAARPTWGGNRQDRTEPLSLSEVRSASRPLEERGLIVDVLGAVAVLPPLAKALRLTATEHALEALRGPETAPPYPFFLAVVCALYAVEAPMVTRSGELHARSEQKLLRRLGGESIWGFSIEFAEKILRRVGALIEQSRGNSTCLRVDSERAAAALSAPPETVALAAVHVASASESLLRTLFQVRAASTSKASSDASTEREGATLNEIEAKATAPKHRGWETGTEALDAWELADALRTLRTNDLVDVAPGGPPTRVRATTPRAHKNAPWVVQPSFEVLVPWDAAPWRVATLGCFADLEQADRVCKFRLTPESVARGIGGLDPAHLVTTLAEGSDLPLPQNVRVTLEGWIGRGRPLRSVRGDVMIAADDAQRDFLSGLGDGVVEVAANVFYVERDVIADVEAAAKKRGFALAPRVGGAEDEGPWRPEPVDVESEARAARAQLDWLAAAEADKKGGDPRRTRSAGRSKTESRTAGDADRARRDAVAREDALRRLGLGAGDFDEDGEDLDAREEFDEDDLDDATQVRRRSAEGPSSRPTAAGAVPVASLSAPVEAWESPLPGVLRSVLLDAIRGQKPMTLLYTNRNQESVEHRVVPRGLRTVAGREELLARDAATDSECVLPLDRITAIQRPTP